MVMSSAYETLTKEGLLSPEESAALTKIDPLAETMFLMMAADGNLEQDELHAIRGALRGLSDGLIRTGTMNVMMDNYQKALAKEGREARLQEIAETLAEDQGEAETAFTLAAAVALADGDVADAENELINQLAEWFGIDGDRAEKILDQLEAERGDA